jgi:hypothetical protein
MLLTSQYYLEILFFIWSKRRNFELVQRGAKIATSMTGLNRYFAQLDKGITAYSEFLQTFFNKQESGIHNLQGSRVVTSP